MLEVQTRIVYHCSCGISFDSETLSEHLLSSSEDPSCPECNKSISEVILSEFLGKDWIVKVYNPHRMESFSIWQKSYLFEETKFISIFKKLTEMKKLYQEIIDKRRNLRESKKQLSIHDKYTRKENLARIIKLGRIDWRERQAINEMEVQIFGPNYSESRENDILTGFARCLNLRCKGYVFEEGQSCGLCRVKYCSDCGESINDQEEHVCDKDIALSYKLIISETKPCPNCSIRIQRTDGCDNMYCIYCTTHFNWSTMRIGMIHDETKHFNSYEFLSGLQSDIGLYLFLRNVEDFICYQLSRNFEKLYEKILKKNRINYFAGYISEEEFKTKTFNIVMRNRFLNSQKELINEFYLLFVEEMKTIIPGQTSLSEFCEKIGKTILVPLNEKYAKLCQVFDSKLCQFEIKILNEEKDIRTVVISPVASG